MTTPHDVIWDRARRQYRRGTPCDAVSRSEAAIWWTVCAAVLFMAALCVGGVL